MPLLGLSSTIASGLLGDYPAQITVLGKRPLPFHMVYSRPPSLGGVCQQKPRVLHASGEALSLFSFYDAPGTEEGTPRPLIKSLFMNY